MKAKKIVGSGVKSVLIKGGVDHARAAARDRKIELMYLREIPAFGGVSTIGYARAGAWDLDRWLVEGKSPRVAGSLLYWSYVDEVSELAARLRETYGGEVDWSKVPLAAAEAVFERRVAWATLEIFEDGEGEESPLMTVALDFGVDPPEGEHPDNDGSLLPFESMVVGYPWAIHFVHALGLEYAGTSDGVDTFEAPEASVSSEYPEGSGG